jgi:hypothetical protein
MFEIHQLALELAFDCHSIHLKTSQRRAPYFVIKYHAIIPLQIKTIELSRRRALVSAELIIEHFVVKNSGSQPCFWSFNVTQINVRNNFTIYLGVGFTDGAKKHM